MIKTDIKFLLDLIGRVITGGEAPKAPENIDWSCIYDICERHSVANILSYAASSEKYDMPSEIKKKLQRKMFEAVAVNENQKVAFSTVFKEFEDKNIDYMPLKGIVLKSLYASEDMRNMSDGDILIKSKQFEAFDAVMKSLGYEYVKESNHEYIYKKPPFVNVELHKILVPSYNYDLYSYYGDGWRLAERKELSSRFDLNADNTFIYVFTHYAKHYRDGGAGIKYVADIWLCLKKLPLDTAYVFSELEKLGLRAFAENTIRLTKAWFDGEEYDYLTEQMTEYIILGGEYGSVKNAALASELRENCGKTVEKVNKTKKIRLLFPTLTHMRKSYKPLEKYPFLIPFFWLIRILRSIVYAKKSADTLKKKTTFLTDENLSGFDRHMREVGLDIYNGKN